MNSRQKEQERKRKYFKTKKEALDEKSKNKNSKIGFRIYYDAYEEGYYLIKFKKKGFWDK